jgi:beta-N-acetylhexosaminidase
VIGIRSFGDDAKLVADLGVALIRGMQAARALATAKHFPGHGDTAQDSHVDLSVVPHSMERMEAVELYPFREAIKADVAAIMTAHLMFPALDTEQPATLSAKTLNQFLRQKMGFKGLILTDAMDMHAIAQYGHMDSIRKAIAAGADLVMLGHIEDQMKIMEDLNTVPTMNTAARIKAARTRVPTDLPSVDVIGCAEHQKIAQDIADASITMVRRNGHLPLTNDKQVAIIVPRPVDLTPADTSSFVKIKLVDTIRKRHSNVIGFEMPFNANSNYISSLVEAVKDADIVIVGTISVERDQSQIDLVRALHERGKTPIVVALRTPYDLVHFPMIHTYLCSYGIREASMEAVARVLFGEIEAKGTLPCNLPDTMIVQ